jgi:hypothetical protein
MPRITLQECEDPGSRITYLVTGAAIGNPRFGQEIIPFAPRPCPAAIR